jgi:chromosomal replication initiator protein DnaA
MKEANKKLAELLIREELLTRQQYEDALKEKDVESQFLGEVLLRLHYLNEEQLIGCLVRHCRIPHLKLSNLNVRLEAAELIPAKFCFQFRLLPIDKLGTLLTVAMVNPLDTKALEAVKKQVKLRIKPILCSCADFNELYVRIYGSDGQKIKQGQDDVIELEEETEEKEAKKEKKPTKKAPAEPERTKKETAPSGKKEPEQKAGSAAGLIERFQFENFVVAEANSFTYALAKSVSESPGSEYNPLFIYGNTGLGKTHLSNAIGNEAFRRNQHLLVVYVPASKFIDEMLQAIEQEKMKEFRNTYSEVDILIVDDVQFLSSRTKAQEEFFNIFNAIYNRKRQVILVSDVPPKELKGLESRLISRFEGGVVACMEEPDYQTRLAILRQESQSVGAIVPEDVLELLANLIPTNIRELEGALKKLLAYSSLVGHDITTELAQEILKHLFRPVQT